MNAARCSPLTRLSPIVGLGLLLMFAAVSAQDVPAHSELPAPDQTATDGFEPQPEDAEAAAADQSDGELLELPAARTALPVVEHAAPVEAGPLTEVAPARRVELIREAAPPRPNADGHYLAADLVGAGMLSGPGFSLAPEVEVRGYMLHFVLQTDFGHIDAESRDLLPIRIEEIAALERLDDTAITEAIGKRAKQRSKRVWTGLKRIFTRPKETVVGLPKGVANMISTRARKLGRQVSNAYDRSRDRLAEDGSSDDPGGPFTAARPPEPERDPNDSGAKREAKRAGKSLLKQELDYSSTRRFIAQEVGVDPYTSNPVLKEKLNAIAWAATSSNVAFKLVMGALSTATAGVLPQLLKIDKTVWEQAPEELSQINRGRLNALGCSGGLTRRVVRNGAFSPTLETDLVNALEKLALPRGCDDVLEMAIDASGEVEARFMVNSLRLLLAAPLPGRIGYGPGECEIEALGGGLGARCQGELLVPLPLDALLWDEDIALFLDAEDVRQAGARTLLLTGFADPEARRQLTNRGFAIVERAPLE
jgi:hypothetical protein